MLSLVGIGAPEAKPDPGKPMCAVSNEDQRNGVPKGRVVRVKVVIPEAHRAKVDAKALWLGCYKGGEGLAAVVHRIEGSLESLAAIDTSTLEVGAWYVFSLKEGEAWPFITTHCTTSRFVITEPAVVPPVVRGPPPSSRALPVVTPAAAAADSDTPPRPTRSSSQPAVRRSEPRTVVAPVPRRVVVPSRPCEEAMPVERRLSPRPPPRSSSGAGDGPLAISTSPVPSTSPKAVARRPPSPSAQAPTPPRVLPRRGSAPALVAPREPALSPPPSKAVAEARAPVRASLGSPAPSRVGRGEPQPAPRSSVDETKSFSNTALPRLTKGRVPVKKRLVRCVVAHCPSDPTVEIATEENETMELILDMGNGWLRVKRVDDDFSGLIPDNTVEEL